MDKPNEAKSNVGKIVAIVIAIIVLALLANFVIQSGYFQGEGTRTGDVSQEAVDEQAAKVNMLTEEAMEVEKTADTLKTLAEEKAADAKAKRAIGDDVGAAAAEAAAKELGAQSASAGADAATKQTKADEEQAALELMKRLR